MAEVAGRRHQARVVAEAQPEADPRIFVQSRGFGNAHDYCWIAVERANEGAADPSLFEEWAVWSLIDREAFCVGIARRGVELLAVVAGLPTGERVDFQRRRIRNGLVVIGAMRHQALIRAIATIALRDEAAIGRLLDDTIRSSDTSQVGFDVVEDFAERLAAAMPPTRDDPSDQRFRLALDSEARRKELADELTAHLLPEIDGALVVVTRATSFDSLKSAGAWRSLTSESLVVGAHWRTYQPPKSRRRLRGGALDGWSRWAFWRRG